MISVQIDYDTMYYIACSYEILGTVLCTVRQSSVRSQLRAQAFQQKLPWRHYKWAFDLYSQYLNQTQTKIEEPAPSKIHQLQNEHPLYQLLLFEKINSAEPIDQIRYDSPLVAIVTRSRTGSIEFQVFPRFHTTVRGVFTNSFHTVLHWPWALSNNTSVTKPPGVLFTCTEYYCNGWDHQEQLAR